MTILALTCQESELNIEHRVICFFASETAAFYSRVPRGCFFPTFIIPDLFQEFLARGLLQKFPVNARIIRLVVNGEQTERQTTSFRATNAV